MTERDWFPELPYEEIEIEAITHIVDEMFEFGLDLRKHAPSLRRMFAYAERMYRETMEEHLRRNEPEGSKWKPYKNPKKNYSKDDIKSGPDYDYGEDSNLGHDETYEELYADLHGRPRQNPGVFHNSGGLPRGPLMVIYRVVNLWYRHYLKEKFVPRFGPDRKENPETYKWEEVPGIMVPRNPAAHLFLWVANELDNNYKVEQCRLVHGTERKKIDKTIPD